KIAHARAFASAFFFQGVAKVPFFTGFPLHVRAARRAGVSGAASGVHREGARNAAILVAKSALSACSASAQAVVQRIRMRMAWMAMIAQSGDRSSPATAGISRRIGRNTGSHSVASTDCSGEEPPGAMRLSRGDTKTAARYVQRRGGAI